MFCVFDVKIHDSFTVTFTCSGAKITVLMSQVFASSAGARMAVLIPVEESMHCLAVGPCVGDTVGNVGAAVVLP